MSYGNPAPHDEPTSTMAPTQPLNGDQTGSDSRTLLTTRLERIDSERHDLLLRRCAILAELNDLTPIGRLPDECLSMIFLQVLALIWLQWDHRHAIHRLPIVLSLVSGRWHQVVLQTPRLWSVLFVDIAREIDRKEYMKGLKNRLSLTKAAPLEIGIRCTHSYSAREIYIHNDMEVLSPYFVRCRSLHMRIPRRSASRAAFIAYLLLELPLLEDLAIENHSNYHCVQVPMPVTTARLRTLSLSAVYLLVMSKASLVGLSSLRLKYGGICNMDAGDGASPDLEVLWDNWTPESSYHHDDLIKLDILRTAVDLEELTIQGTGMHCTGSEGRVQFSQLRSLSVAPGYTLAGHYTDDSEPVPTFGPKFMTLFRDIRMPALRTLLFCGLFMKEGILADDALRILGPNLMGLHSLSIERAGFTAAVLLDLLGTMPSLHTLILRRATVSAQFLDGLRPKKANTICTGLTNLHLVDAAAACQHPEGYKPYTVSALRRLLKSRHSASNVASIHTLVLAETRLRVKKDVFLELRGYVTKLQRVPLNLSHFFDQSDSSQSESSDSDLSF